jgi:oligo-1,6-glucosidase
LRRTEPTVAYGDFRMLLVDHDQVYAFTRRHNNTEVLVLANFPGEPTTIEIPDLHRWQDTELVLANVPEPEELENRLTHRVPILGADPHDRSRSDDPGPRNFGPS